MAVQIFGTKKCKDTQKALRFFKERRIELHFIDLNEKGLSPGELKNICRSVDLKDLLDRESREYEKLSLQYMQFNIEQKLLENPMLIKTPIVRCGAKSTVGFVPDMWKEFK